MNQPFTGERFWSEGRGARRRDPDGTVHRIKTRPCASLAQAVLTTTAPDMFAAPAEAARFDALKSRARMTRYGGDCYGYCLLAAGFVDLIVESGLKSYDIAPLIPIIEGAGGVVTTWEGGPAAEGRPHRRRRRRPCACCGAGDPARRRLTGVTRPRPSLTLPPTGPRAAPPGTASTGP